MVDFFDAVCCVCLVSNDRLVCLTDGLQCSYLDKLRAVLPELGWSKRFRLCHSCAAKVTDCYDFVQTCRNSETQRRDNLPLSEALDTEETKSLKNELSEFRCQECDKDFKQARSLKMHNTRIHRKNAEETDNTAKNEDGGSQEELFNSVETRASSLRATRRIVSDSLQGSCLSDDSFVDQANVCGEQGALNAATQLTDNQPQLPNNAQPNDDFDDVFKDLIEFESHDDSDFEVEKPAKKQKKERKRRPKIKLPVKCDYCGKDFNRKQHLLAHIRCIHTFEKPYSCDQCDAKFSLSHSLLVHKRRHNDDRRYVCTYCGKKFLCSTDLVHHNKIHLNKREYKCEPCNKSFNTISVLQIHKKCVHTDPSMWKHICQYCSRRFPIKSSLTAHLRRHTGEKNFSCNICGKSFYDKKMVENHYRSHTDERLFKCHLCEKDYKDRGGLNLHLKKVHDVGNATIPPPPPKKFGCHLCPKAFSSRGKLQKHICTHTGEKMFNCHLCDKKFNDSWYKKVHMQRKHNVNPGDEEAAMKSVVAEVPIHIHLQPVQLQQMQFQQPMPQHHT